jgi:hypothetical protein
MYEDVFRAIIAHDEAKTLLRVEEFDDTGAFANNLRRHAATAAARATTEAAATTATAGKTTAIAAAEPATVTAAGKAGPITAAEAAAVKTTAAAATEAPTGVVKIIFAETVALVLAAPAAATSVKTHALLVTFASPQDKSRQACRANDMQNPPQIRGLGITISIFWGSANDFSPIAATI